MSDSRTTNLTSGNLLKQIILFTLPLIASGVLQQLGDALHIDMESSAYAYTMECLHTVFPRYPAAPYILPAGTDAWKLTPVCDCVLRFAPTRMSSKQLASIHAVDENLDVSAVAEAAAFYKYFVKNYR